MLLNKLFKFFPEGYLKNKISCLYYNTFKKNDFKIHYKKDYFLVVFDDFTLKFYDNPYDDISIPLRGYLKKYSIKKRDVVIDAGAYIGAFSLVASKIVGKKGKVIAFEPDKESYQKLLNNMGLNGADNIIAINKGVWSEKTSLKLGNACSGGSSFFFDKTKKNHVFDVEAVSLDDELKRLTKRVDFIKMDVEGAEIEAIKGCKAILMNNDVKLAIASYHTINGQKTCLQLEALLARLGYKAETSFSEHLTTYANKYHSEKRLI